MKVALINPFKFQSKLSKKNEPIALNYIKSYLLDKGYFVEVFDFEIIYNNIERVIYNIAYKFNVVGISCYFPYLPDQLAIKFKKINPNIIVIAGGPMASLAYKELLLSNNFIDYIIVNEGEISFYMLLESLRLNRPKVNIPGVAYCNNGIVKYNKQKFCECLDEFNFPIRELGYFKNYIPSLISSRGCNSNCRFCSTRYAGRWRFRTPENVFKEIKHIVKFHKCYYFQFLEPNFLEDIDRAVEIAKLISNLPYNVQYDFACRIDSILNNEEELCIIKNSGAIKILLGVENFNNRTLYKWAKGITTKDICDAIILLNKLNFNYSISLILFHPETSINELKENIKKIEMYNLANKIENIYNYLRLIPGTALNPTTQNKLWHFENIQAERIFKKCMEYESKQCKKIKAYSSDININNIYNNLDDFSNLLYYLNNEKEMKFLFLKKILHLSNDFDEIMECDKINLLFKYNSNSNLTFRKEEGIFEFYNKETGLIYNLNETIIRQKEIIKNRTIAEIVKQLYINQKKYGNIFIENLIQGIILLTKEQIIILKEELK